VLNTFGLDAQLFGTLLQKMPRQHEHIFAALTQGWQTQANHIEPETDLHGSCRF
jgi:hypothetical protein